MGVAVRLDVVDRHGGPSMATYDKMSAQERQRLIEGLGSLTGLQEGPNGQLPDGTHYEYDPDLRTTVEVTPSGERLPVVLVEGKLQRESEALVARKGEAA
jgi:hypothetical protein